MTVMDVVYAVVQSVPLIVTVVIGLVLMISRRDRLRPAARRLGITGASLVALDGVGLGAFILVQPALYDSFADSDVATTVSLVYTVFSAILYCTGVGLLLGAILSGTGRSAPPAAPPARPYYGPPGYPTQPAYSQAGPFAPPPPGSPPAWPAQPGPSPWGPPPQ